VIQDEAEHRMTARPKRILLVDDDVALTRLFRRNLEDEAGYEVRIENSGCAGLAALREFNPDLIVLDVVMPGMTGREMAAVVGADPDRAKTPIIFMTAVPPDGSPESWDAELDGRPCMIKPFGTSKAVAAIESALARHGDVV